MNKETFSMITRLVNAGISGGDAWALRRIAMTLHRWGELECGTDSGCIERDEKTGKPLWRYSDGRSGGYVRDMERGALSRLEDIMERYPSLLAYHQTDPRGASLYVIRPGDVPEGADRDAYYNRGIAVHR